MPNLQRISEEIQAAQRPERQIGGHIEAGGTGSPIGGHVGSEAGSRVGGGNIGSASGITGATAAQAMRKAGSGPAPDRQRVNTHRPKAAAANPPTDYPKGWLTTTASGRVI
jgi:hypothetical protein